MRALPVFLVLVFVQAAPGESWAPYTYREHRSPSDRYVLRTSKGKSGGLAWQLRRRKGGSPKVGKRAGRFERVGQGEYGQLPFGIHVLSNGKGMVFFERYGHPGTRNTLALVGPDGKPAFAVGLREVLGGHKIEPSPLGANWMWRAWWVDEDRNVAVLVTRDDHVRLVDLATGKGKAGVFADELLHAARKLRWARTLAFEILRTKPGVKDVSSLRGLLKRKGTSPIHRLRAALLLNDRGVRPIERDDFQAVVGQRKISRSDANFWSTEANRVLDAEQALELFEDAAVQARAPILGVTAVYGLRLLNNAEAGASVVRLIGHGDARPAVREAATKAAGQMKIEHVLPRLLRNLRGMEHDPVTAGRLLTAAFALDPSGLANRIRKEQPVVLAALKRGVGPQEFLTAFMAQYPTTEAIRPLLRQLRRVRNDTRKRKITIIALRECSGQDFGDDVEAWLTKTVGR